MRPALHGVGTLGRLLVGTLLVACGLRTAAAESDPVRLVATVPDLGNLAEQIGAEEIAVTVFAKGPQDPHFIEPKPSFIRALHDADLYLQMGMDLEIGWAPVLLRGARNSKVLPGSTGHLDASQAIDPLEVPTTPTDRSMGDVHPYGNPHYLMDPLNGLRIAALVREKLIELRPARSEAFQARYEVFARRLVERLVGSELAARYPRQEIVGRVEGGELRSFLRERGEGALLGGWLGAVQPYQGTKAIEDHQHWAYFARRFGLVLVGTLEPKPGIAPTTRHLGKVVEKVRLEGVPLLLASPYIDLRHARWVAQRTGARIVKLAHQGGSREGTGDYLETIDYNVRQLLEALRGEAVAP
jgi:ABC-type Zn uptake system ZnuABC Zn-binding protein ZnuA